MLTGRILTVVHAFWVAHLGCPADELLSAPWRVIIHGAAWADYHGVFAVFREGAAIASVPAEHAQLLRKLMSPLVQESSPERLAAVLAPVSALVLGPSYLGYAENVSPPKHPARELAPDDAAALAALRQACDSEEWAHGTSDAGCHHTAVFVGDRMAALASYEVWDNVIAHLYIITHPEFRGRSFGSSAVAFLARQATAAGLLPQYRALMSNRASVGIAKRLGFQQYATLMSVRLRPDL